MMAAEGGWTIADLSSLGGWGTFLITVGGLFHLHGRQTKSAENIAEKAKEAKTEAKAVADDLAAYKVEAVEKFVPRAHLDQMENRILKRMDTQDERSDASLRGIAERLDRIIEGRTKA
jgi:cobalamin biosynthesis protein CbiD